MPLGSITSLLLAGGLVARRRSATVVTSALCLYSASLASLGLLTSQTVFAIGLFCFGFFGNLFNIAVNTQAVAIETRYGRSILASFHALFSLGFVIGAAGGGVVARAGIPVGPQFLAVATLSSLVVLPLHRLLGTEHGPAADAPRFGLRLRDRRVLVLGLIVFCGVLSEGAMIDWSIVFYRQYVRDSVEMAAMALTTFSLAMTLGRLGGDWAVDRYGARRVQRANGVALGVGMLLCVLLRDPVVTVCGYALIGLAVANIIPISYSLAARVPSVSPSVALASIATIGFIGFVSGPPLIGLLSALLSLRAALGAIVVLGVLVAVLSGSLAVR